MCLWCPSAYWETWTWRISDIFSYKRTQTSEAVILQSLSFSGSQQAVTARSDLASSTVSSNNFWGLHRIMGRIKLIYDFGTFLASSWSAPRWNASEQAGVGVYVAAMHSYLSGKVHVGLQCKVARGACGDTDPALLLRCRFNTRSINQA